GDIQRYLHDEPVQAWPPSAVYRFRKFARRNKGALLTTALLGVALLLVVGVVAGSIGWVSRDRAARMVITEREIDLALDEVDRLYQKDKWLEAIAAVKRAETPVSTGGGD